MDNNKNKVIKDSEIPKYTKGGGDYKNTFVLVGENKPEVIIQANGEQVLVPESIRDFFLTKGTIPKYNETFDYLKESIQDAIVESYPKK